MKTYGTLKLMIAVLLIGFGSTAIAQTYTLNNKASSLSIDGTSNIHDWTIEAESFTGTITAEFDEGQLKEIENLEFSVEVESLESGKGAMNKNTYKALNIDDHKRILYKLKKINDIQNFSGDSYKVKTTGTLEISGTKKDISLDFDLETTENKIILKGEHSLKMTDYGVEPPSAMFGTITTGDSVKIKFETHFNQ
ncbi:YceI family protein [Christiangramia sp.]|uniref:YceI family protein n=1 Tax=Christiangramia sp. TaxID=1931228 RepID=UPI002620B163|nr:YceI family protein [Christiangramia sp.]